jgi:fructokinase
LAFGGIEAGGTKWVCGVVPDDSTNIRSEVISTTTPDETISRAVDFFRSEPRLEAIGIGAFGPITLDRSSPYWGHIGRTPKPGWSHVDVVGPFSSAFDIPIALDTDVNVAGIGEGSAGAGVGLRLFSYVTVGTGIGSAAILGGTPICGSKHPEFGHIRVPHDWEVDPFKGSCPFHGDCLEGLASGRALEQRWGVNSSDLKDPGVWELEAEYLAQGLLNLTLILSPERIILGGGVSSAPNLLPLVRSRIQGLLGGYLELPQFAPAIGEYLVDATLGAEAGLLGAIELARRFVCSEAQTFKYEQGDISWPRSQ